MPRIRITKNGRRLIYVGIAAYLVFLLHALPASILTRYVLPSLDRSHDLRLQGVRGTIWQGEAINASVSNFNVGKLNWDLNSWGAVQAEDVNLQLPAENLMPLFYGYPVSVAGMLRGNLKQVSVERGRVLQAQGRIVWQNASIKAPQNIEMGDYLITLEPVNLGSKMEISDQGRGPIQAKITIFVKGTGEYRLNGWFKSRDPNQQDITEALRLIGRPDSSGRYWVRINSRLRGWRK
ncbi:MAG: type II secretion system protein N [Gammaproteobacteria bacterium]